MLQTMGENICIMQIAAQKRQCELNLKIDNANQFSKVYLQEMAHMKAITIIRVRCCLVDI